jgi:hypothetical protein
VVTKFNPGGTLIAPKNRGEYLMRKVKEQSQKETLSTFPPNGSSKEGIEMAKTSIGIKTPNIKNANIDLGFIIKAIISEPQI